jgi:16S rRNA G1207 methylase RsmC
LLRREGLYTSHLTYWRKQRKDGALTELGKPRGRQPVDKRDAQIAALTRRAERAEAELAKMTRVVEIQGNLSALLEQMLGTESSRRSSAPARRAGRWAPLRRRSAVAAGRRSPGRPSRDRRRPGR